MYDLKKNGGPVSSWPWYDKDFHNGSTVSAMYLFAELRLNASDVSY